MAAKIAPYCAAKHQESRQTRVGKATRIHEAGAGRRSIGEQARLFEQGPDRHAESLTLLDRGISAEHQLGPHSAWKALRPIDLGSPPTRWMHRRALVDADAKRGPAQCCAGPFEPSTGLRSPEPDQLFCLARRSRISERSLTSSVGSAAASSAVSSLAVRSLSLFIGTTIAK